MDTSAAFGTRYRYMIQALDGELRQSELSNPVEITPKDEFPPAVPSGISAVAGADAIELSWERNTEDDFAGYVVYRAAGDAAFERLAGPIEAPVYSDRAIETGKRYRYSVTAVDAAGNESARSVLAEATAQ
jgi:fibronectin type 3 domain-containing protein